ncbi:DUF2513 domain-containing protein [Herbaspirillum sp. RU 5E]|nr:DUF2513 domain-containing protein [Herbaspirillum sp. RU 5E]
MKRDPDLIRKIAFAIEELEPGQFLHQLDAMDPHLFAIHVAWMEDAGLIVAQTTKFLSGPPAVTVYRLTWSGCDFLDAARSDTLWNKAKKSVLAPGASWTFDVLKEWLKAEIKNGLPTLRSLGS